MRYDVNENHMLQMLDDPEPIGYTVKVLDDQGEYLEEIYVEIDEDIDAVIEIDLGLVGHAWVITDEIYE